MSRVPPRLSLVIIVAEGHGAAACLPRGATGNALVNRRPVLVALHIGVQSRIELEIEPVEVAQPPFK